MSASIKHQEYAPSRVDSCQSKAAQDKLNLPEANCYQNNIWVDAYQSLALSPQRSINKSLRIDYVGEYPKARRNGWSKELQGVTHDGDSWFITQKDKLWKFPRGHDFNEKLSKPIPDRGILAVTIPDHLQAMGYDHMGDIDHYDGRIYVPLENKVYANGHMLLVFDAKTMKLIRSYQLSKKHMKSASWVAVDEKSGLIFTSNNVIEKGSPIIVYSEGFGENKGVLKIKGGFYPLDKSGRKMRIERVQGGVISSDERVLFLVSDAPKGGVLAFDLGTKRLIAHYGVDYKQRFPFYEELQGITIWPEEGHGSERFGGNLHMIMLDNDACDDDFYFKHFQYSAGVMVPTIR